MAKQVKSEEVVEKDVFADLRKSAEITEKAVHALEVTLESVSAAAKQLKTAVPKDLPVNAKGLEDLNLAQQRSNTLAQTRLQVDKDLQKEKLRLSEQQRILNLQIRDEIALEQKSEQSYNAQSKALNALKREYKDLATQNKLNTKEAKDLLAEITKLDTKLKTVDATVGEHTRKVGQYENATANLTNKLRGAANVLGNFGISLGLGAIASKGINVISEFETQVADLSAVTGQTGKDLEFLEDKAITFSKKFGASAASIAEAFKLAGSARPELLQNGQALADLTEKAIILSKASGDDVPTSIQNLTGTLNAFEMPASEATKVMDTLANAAQLGSQEIPYLTEAFTKFGAIAKSSNVSVAESAAAVELLGQKMPDAASAGTGLRNVMLKLMAPEALGADAQKRLKELGVNFGDLQDKSKPFADRLATLKPLLTDSTALVKVFGTENAVAAQILLSQTDKLKEFTAGLDKNGTAQAQAETKSKTLTEAWGRMKANFEAMFLDFRDSASSVSGALDFLSANLGTIVTTLGYVIKAFLSYKSVMFGLKMRDRVSEFIQFNKAVKEGAASASDAGSGVQRFGQALKGAGIGIAITLLAELAMEIYHVASGAADAERKVEGMNRAISLGADAAGKRVQHMRDEIGLGKMTEAQAMNQLKMDISRLNVKREQLKLTIEQLKATDLYQNAVNTNPALRTGFDEIAIKQYETLRNELYRVDSALTTYNRELTDMRITEVQATQATENLNETTKESVPATKNRTKALEDQAKATEEVLNMNLELEKSLTQMSYEEIWDPYRKAAEALADVNREMQNLIDSTEWGGENRTGPIDVQAEVIPGFPSADAIKSRAEQIKKALDFLTDYFTKRADARIKKIDQEMQAAQKQADLYRDLARQGVITSKESIAEQDRIAAEAAVRKEREERRKQRLLTVTSFLQAYNSNLANGDDSTKAFTKAVTSSEVLKQFITGLPTFLEGIEDTGKQGTGLDGKGGFLSILHPNERVLTAQQNAMIGGATNTEVAEIMQKHRIGKLVDSAQVGGAWQSASIVKELMGVKDGIAEVKKAIVNKPETNIELGRITQSVVEIVETNKRPNLVTKRITRIGK